MPQFHYSKDFSDLPRITWSIAADDQSIAAEYRGLTWSGGEVGQVDVRRAVRFGDSWITDPNGDQQRPIVFVDTKPALVALVTAAIAQRDAKVSAQKAEEERVRVALKGVPDDQFFDVDHAPGVVFTLYGKQWVGLGRKRVKIWDDFEDEQVWRWCLGCRLATAEEIAADLVVQKQRRDVSRARKNARSELRRLVEQIRRGEKPVGPVLAEGEEIVADEGDRLYGGGAWFVLGPEWIWHVLNNGRDGDDWSPNNVRTGGAGAIGYRLPADPELAQQIRDVAARCEFVPKLTEVAGVEY